MNIAFVLLFPATTKEDAAWHFLGSRVFGEPDRSATGGCPMADRARVEPRRPEAGGSRRRNLGVEGPTGLRKAPRQQLLPVLLHRCQALVVPPKLFLVQAAVAVSVIAAELSLVELVARDVAALVAVIVGIGAGSG